MKELINQKFGASFKLELLDVCQRHEIARHFVYVLRKVDTSKLAHLEHMEICKGILNSTIELTLMRSLSFTNF